jgi:hypothetical protein
LCARSSPTRARPAGQFSLSLRRLLPHLVDTVGYRWVRVELCTSRSERNRRVDHLRMARLKLLPLAEFVEHVQFLSDDVPAMAQQSTATGQSAASTTSARSTGLCSASGASLASTQLANRTAVSERAWCGSRDAASSTWRRLIAGSLIRRIMLRLARDMLAGPGPGARQPSGGLRVRSGAFTFEREADWESGAAVYMKASV